MPNRVLSRETGFKRNIDFGNQGLYYTVLYYKFFPRSLNKINRDAVHLYNSDVIMTLEP